MTLEEAIAYALMTIIKHDREESLGHVIDLWLPTSGKLFSLLLDQGRQTASRCLHRLIR